MKREIYNLSDEEFAYFVNEIGRSFDATRIPYIFVGGTAVQLHIIKRLHEKHGADIVTLLRDVRFQDYIRSTDDIDLALSQEVYPEKESITSREVYPSRKEVEYAKTINAVLDSLKKEVVSPSGEHILEYKIARRGVKRPVFSILVDGETSERDSIALNINRKPSDLRNLESSLYQTFVDERERIVVPYNSSFSIDVSVIPLLYLLATKISHFRPKDTMDIHNLADLIRDTKEELDLARLQEILGVDNTRNYDRFLSLAKLENH